MIEQEKMYHREDLQLKMVWKFGGYEVENLFWEFLTYAVVTEQDGVFTDVVDGTTYIKKRPGEASLMPGEERVSEPYYYGVSEHIYFKNEMNSVDDIKRAMKKSGLSFRQDLTCEDHQDSTYRGRIATLIKSLKR